MTEINKEQNNNRLIPKYLDVMSNIIDEKMGMNKNFNEKLKELLLNLSVVEARGLTKDGIEKFRYTPGNSDVRGLCIDYSQISDTQNVCYQIILDVLHKKEECKYPFLAEGFRESLAKDMKTDLETDDSLSNEFVNLLAHIDTNDIDLSELEQSTESKPDMTDLFINAYTNGSFKKLIKQMEKNDKIKNILVAMNSAYISSLFARKKETNETSINRNIENVNRTLHEYNSEIFVPELCMPLRNAKKFNVIVSKNQSKDIVMPEYESDNNIMNITIEEVREATEEEKSSIKIK